MFSLANVLHAEIGAEAFEIPDGFSLREWAEQSFGVFHDKPHGVVLRFRPESAALAREYRFHPTQTIEEQADGSLLVRFRAGGLWEMAWHLFQWRDGVEVVEPEALRHELVAMLEDALRAHRRS
jgi:predicted DNA-binding transcriptional regulator YafY